MRFRLDVVPTTTTAQHKGVFVANGRVRFYTKAEVRRAESVLAALLAPHRPAQPFAVPLYVEIGWTFPYRKSERRSVVRSGASIPHDTRPDLDNLEKSMLDVLTRMGFWLDDSLVAVKRTSKRRGPRPGIDIAIEALPGGAANFFTRGVAATR